MISKIKLGWVPLITMMGMASCSNADGNYQEKYNELVLHFNKVLYQKNALAKKSNEQTAEIIRLEDELDTLKRTIRSKSTYAQINKLYDDERAINRRLREDLTLLEIEANTLYKNIKAFISYLEPKLPTITIAIGDDDNITVNGVKLIK